MAINRSFQGATIYKPGIYYRTAVKLGQILVIENLPMPTGESQVYITRLYNATRFFGLQPYTVEHFRPTTETTCNLILRK